MNGIVDESMRALLDVNRRALELTADAKPAADGFAEQRVNFGAYVFEERETPAAGGEA